jgi:hypothetical protein
MAMTKKTATCLLVVLLAAAAWADTARDREAYCAYVLGEAQAQKIYLRSPSVEFGLSQQPIAAGVPQTFVGITNHLSDDLKSRSVMKAAGKDCELYRASVEVQQHLQYALPGIERDAVKTKLKLIQRALARLERMIAESDTLVAARNLTISNLYGLRYERTKLKAQRAQEELSLATLWVPELSNEPLRVLLSRKQNLEVEKQKAVHQVARHDNWDVAFTAGVHRSATEFSSGSFGAYGGFSLRYSLGAPARDRALDRAVAAYGDWKQAQQNDAMQAAEVLRQEITDSIVVQGEALSALQAERDEIEGTLSSVAGLDTSAAVAFASRLAVDKLTLDIEIETAQFRLARLREYLSANF